MRLPQFSHIDREYVTAVSDKQTEEIDICAAPPHTVENVTVSKNNLIRYGIEIDYLNYYLRK